MIPNNHQPSIYAVKIILHAILYYTVHHSVPLMYPPSPLPPAIITAIRHR